MLTRPIPRGAAARAARPWPERPREHSEQERDMKHSEQERESTGRDGNFALG